MGRYGKKNEVKINPLSYNICLLGEPKIGKTQTVKQFCEKVGGEDSYIFLELAGEAGADAITGIVYEDVDTWADLEEIIDDIEMNKTTDYPDLKVIVMDTYDGWITLAEEEAIRLWNKAHPDKKADSIDASWNGFQKGQKKAFDLMFDIICRLRAVGVATIVIGHVKNREQTDVASGTTYTTLTSDVEKVYFNLLKKKMHFMGLAYYDREIVTEKTGKKNVVTKKDITINKIMGESRKIKWRDDNYSIDSGSRFADIVDEIPLDADEMIKAITDAIVAEAEKGSKSVDTLKKEQAKANKEKEKEIAAEEVNKKNRKELETVIASIIDACKADKDLAKNVVKECKELGYSNPKEVDELEVAKKLLAMCE